MYKPNLFLHMQPYHFSSALDGKYLDSRPEWVKLVTVGGPPNGLGHIAPPTRVIIRDHPITENWGQRGIADFVQAHRMAERHYQAYTKLRDELVKQGLQDKQLWFETLNEPRLHSDEKPEFVNAYLRRFLELAHAGGMRLVVGNFSVGWPADFGYKDSPVNWLPFSFLSNMGSEDILGLHEYGSLKDDGLLWWVGRFLQCPFRGKIALTELGIDGMVAGGNQHRGWHHLSPKREEALGEYRKRLLFWRTLMLADSRLVGGFLFTWDTGSHDWDSFDHRSEDVLRLLEEVNAYQPEVWGDTHIWRWKYLVDEAAQKTGLPAEVLGTIIKIESNGFPFAVNPVSKATGLMQVMPKEAANPVFRYRPSQQQLLQPKFNIEFGADLLNSYRNYFDGDLRRAIRAYYTGPGNVDGTAGAYYQGEFEKAWVRLWRGKPLPYGTGGKVVIVKSAIKDATWHAEEAAREARAGKGQDAHDRLVREVIPLLAKLRDDWPLD